MEEDRVIEQQRKFSNLHLIILLLLSMLIIEHEINLVNYDGLKVLLVCAIVSIVESYLKIHSFFGKIRVVMVYRYVQVLGLSMLMFFDIDLYVRSILYVVFLLVSMEFVINYDISDKYTQYLSLAFTIVPATVIQIIRAVFNVSANAVFTNIISIVLTSVALLAVVRYQVDESDRMELKYLAQLRYIEDANAVNQQLVENQEKLKKANEQLAYRKLQLEFANRKINNVNVEISLQNQILKLISARHDVDNLMELIASTIRAQMEVDTFAIILLPSAVTSHKLSYQIKTSYGIKYQQYLSQQIENGLFDQYIQSKNTFTDNHVKVGTYRFIKSSEVSSIMIIPLVKEKEILGGLYVADSKYDSFIDNVAFFESAVSSINLAIENCNLYARMEEMTIKDELTGIYNRRYLNKICDQYIFESLRDKTPLSVALFDLDKFKNINDSYGHLFGDEALKKISSIAAELAQKVGGIAARYGGEEFMVVFPKRNLNSTYEVVNEYQDKVRDLEFYHNEEVVNLRLSVGIASFPETCLDPNDLLNNSDLAMYYSKQNGRDRITIDSSSIREQVRLKQ